MARAILTVVIFMVCGTCCALKSWEIPRDNLLDHVTRDLDQDWLKYKKAFNKTYDSANEELRRRLFWEDAVRYIRAHNAGYQAGNYSFPVAENHFADMADDEFRKSYLSGMDETESTDAEPESTNVSTIEYILRGGTPQWWPGRDVDWRKKGYVTPVQNQGACASCWAFATVAALEGLYRRKSRRLRKLSEQNLLDCVFDHYTCARGGNRKMAFDYVGKSGGIDLASCYGYHAPPKVNPSCRYKGSCSVLSNVKSNYAKMGDERYLKLVVSALGPVAVGVDASHKSFKQYGGKSSDDVFYEKECYPKNYITHAVTVVGYGTSKNGEDYWIVKNSWGTGWGDKGYIYMARNRGNNCRIADRAIYTY